MAQKTITNGDDGVDIRSDINDNFSELYKVKYITPDEFGAVGAGTTDDSAAFNNMFNVSENKYIRLLKDKTYFIQNYVSIPDCIIEGEGNTSIIKIDGTFVNEDGEGAPKTKGCIYNSNYATEYNSNANKIVFRNLKIYGENFTVRSMLAFANIDYLEFDRVEFYVPVWDNVTYPDKDFYNILDIRACWNNVWIHNCKFENYNGIFDLDGSGNALEITNWNADGVVGHTVTNDCHNAIIENNQFLKDNSDEFFWFNSAVGKIFDIIIRNNYCYHYDNNGVEGGSGTGVRRGAVDYTYSEIANVLIEKNHIHMERAVNSAINCGSSFDGNSVGTWDNFTVRDNYIYIDETEVGNVGTNGGIVFDSVVTPKLAIAENNYIVAKTGMTEKCDIGIAGGTLAKDNYIKGDFDKGLSEIEKTEYNTVDVDGKPSKDVVKSFKDTLKGTDVSEYSKDGNYYSTETSYYKVGAFSCINCVANAPFVTFDKCFFDGDTLSRPIYSVVGYNATFKITDCINNAGSEATIVKTAASGAECIQYEKGNKLGSNGYDDFYSFSDDPANLNTDFRNSAPIGHIIYDKATFTSWQKQVTGSASGSWIKL